MPVVSLVFASAALGDVAEDGTLVYLWLRPYPRWQLAVAAFAASVTVVVPVAVLPLVIAAALTGEGGRLVAAAAAGGLLATIAYSAVFCGLGLRVRRALAWGLAYLLIWEQAVARVSHGAARASLFVNTRSLAALPGPPSAAPQRGGMDDRADRPARGRPGCPRAHLSVARPGGDRLRLSRPRFAPRPSIDFWYFPPLLEGDVHQLYISLHKSPRTPENAHRSVLRLLDPASARSRPGSGPRPGRLPRGRSRSHRPAPAPFLRLGLITSCLGLSLRICSVL